MTTYIVYRNGGGAMEARLRAALIDFYKRRGTLPSLIMVHPAELGQAEAACKALEVKHPVAACGGCLIPEVWLGLPEDAGGTGRPALSTRIITPAREIPGDVVQLTLFEEVDR